MNKLFFLITLILFSFNFSSNSYAQLPSGEQLEKINEKVDELKDKVASRVAQLNLVEKRGIVGIVEKIEGTQITINDLKNKTRIIDTDELTKFSSEENDSFDISDLKEGSQISVLGIYNKDSQRLLARFVNETTIPIFINGVISESDEEEFTLTVVTADGAKYIVDIERVSKTFSYVDSDLETSGFSKINSGENVIVSGFKNEREKNRITASRFIHFPGIPKDPNIKIEIQSPTSSTTPTP